MTGQKGTGCVTRLHKYRLNWGFTTEWNRMKRYASLWARQDSNLQPTDYESAALTT